MTFLIQAFESKSHYKRKISIIIASATYTLEAQSVDILTHTPSHSALRDTFDFSPGGVGCIYLLYHRKSRDVRFSRLGLLVNNRSVTENKVKNHPRWYNKIIIV